MHCHAESCGGGEFWGVFIADDQTILLMVMTSVNSGGTGAVDLAATPSVLAGIPACLRRMLESAVAGRSTRVMHPILISSNSLANRFILERWGIRPSQRRRYRNLFIAVRRYCRAFFRRQVALRYVSWHRDDESITFAVYEFDQVRGNLVLAFTFVPPEESWWVPTRP